MTSKIVSEESLTQDEIILRGKIKTQLVSDHMPGEACFTMATGITLEQTADILTELGLPNAFDNREVYADKRCVDDRWSFVLCVPEEELLETRFALARCESVVHASPNFISYIDEPA